MLEANPNLGWRDVQTILAASARHIGTAVGAGPFSPETGPWTFSKAATWNGGGYHFSNDYGFGLVDALAAVRLAETWTAQSTSANEKQRTGKYNGPDVNVDSLQFEEFKVKVASGVSIEAVELELDWSVPHTWISDLVIELISPAGTVSRLLSRNLADEDFGDWIFTSRAFLGEDSGGTWKIRVYAHGYLNEGVISGAIVRAFGSESDAKNDTYIYTNEYNIYAGKFGHKTELKDKDGGNDFINAAAVSSDSVITLIPGKVGKVDGKSLKIADKTVIEDAFGGDGDDTLVGNGVKNLLAGGRGDDQLSGGAKGDLLDGGEGFDYARYASAPAWVSASLVDGGGSAGHADGDSYKSIEGIVGSDFDDFLEGNSVANVFKGGKGLDALHGGGGPDLLRGEEGSDDALGGSGDDDLFGGKGDDALQGEAGNDELNGSLGADDLKGGGDFDYAIYKFATAKVKADLIQGGSKGEADGDTFSGIEGLIGSDFSDVLSGDAKMNVIIGGDGNDELRGRAGDDYLFGDGGKDVLTGGLGADRLEGGDDFDVAQFDSSSTGVVASLVDGGLTGEAAGDSYIGIEGLTGTHFDDVLVGDETANHLLGRGGDDTLDGQGGDDFLFGDINSDRLIGGFGRDQLGGGKGVDAFIFKSVDDSLPGALDLILDFEDGFDRIDVSAIDAVVSTRFIVDDAFVFIGSAGFTGVAGQLRAVQFSGHTFVQGDVDGNAVRDFEFEIAVPLVLGADDFVL